MKQILAAFMAFMLMASLAGAESFGRSGLEPAPRLNAYSEMPQRAAGAGQLNAAQAGAAQSGAAQASAVQTAQNTAQRSAANGKIHRKRVHAFVSQQMVKPPVAQKPFSQKMRAYQMQPLHKTPAESQIMRPGRNYDNPAANRFGDGSQPNSYISGGGNKQQAD